MSLTVKTGYEASRYLSAGLRAYLDYQISQAQEKGITPGDALGAISPSAGLVSLFKGESAGKSDGNIFSISLENNSTGLLLPSHTFCHYKDVYPLSGGCALLSPGESTKFDFSGDLNGNSDPFCGIRFDLFSADMSFVSGFDISFGNDEARDYYSVREIAAGEDTWRREAEPNDISSIICALVNSKFAVAVTGTRSTGDASAWNVNITVTDYVAQ